MAKDAFVRSVTLQDTEGAYFNGEIWKKSNCDLKTKKNALCETVMKADVGQSCKRLAQLLSQHHCVLSPVFAS